MPLFDKAVIEEPKRGRRRSVAALQPGGDTRKEVEGTADKEQAQPDDTLTRLREEYNSLVNQLHASQSMNGMLDYPLMRQVKQKFQEYNDARVAKGLLPLWGDAS